MPLVKRFNCEWLFSLIRGHGHMRRNGRNASTEAQVGFLIKNLFLKLKDDDDDSK